MNAKVDFTFIRQMMGNDDKVVQKFLTIFKDQCPRQLLELKAYYAGQSWVELSNVAHSLKTQFKYLSVDTLADQAYEIEIRADQLPHTLSQRDELGSIIQLFELGLNDLLQDLTLPS
jgi:HPt (histidine-containing phosphotransfer) domain-containing protein